MSFGLDRLVKLLDVTIHPVIKKRGGMTLLRSRMLSLSCIMAIIACLCFIGIIIATGQTELRAIFIYVITGQSVLFLILNRYAQQNALLSSLCLILLGVLLGMAIGYQGRSIFASGFLWFPVLIMPAFLLCGWRLGLGISAVIMLVALATLAYCLGFGSSLPFQGDRTIGIRAVLLSVVLANGLTLGLVAIYFHLLHDSETSSQAQRSWLQRTARMQELLQMSGHFALQTNGPLDVLGTALHNLEEPLRESVQPQTLLALLKPVESSVQDLAAVSRSFSLFSRRYLEEGLEQTSINAVLQHVDTIYNVGAGMRQARLHWEKVVPDILIYTQTAKLVMLLISVLRHVGAEGGTGLSIRTALEADGLDIHLRYQLALSDQRSVKVQDEVVYDPELTQDLIEGLCTELGVVRSQLQVGLQHEFHFHMLQTQSQARLA
ncbi:MAG TPA: hypothetical protein VE954_02265 [Oligoflexus sp.]|uniref:hypothetical protein n=1 Tax=Oligoflexus sp. TaxID=1971216 RepID=UPI002D453EEC|nr:hypothetical protein [Oligoflexus sp.]HYX31911.1 hypothetical protein [Oligoflexus sp.]